MTETKALDILKGAILLEHRGKALYESVVKTSESEGVKELFNMLSREEDKHIFVLEKQFSRISKGESFDLKELEETMPQHMRRLSLRKSSRIFLGLGMKRP